MSVPIKIVYVGTLSTQYLICLMYPREIAIEVIGVSRETVEVLMPTKTEFMLCNDNIQLFKKEL